MDVQDELSRKRLDKAKRYLRLFLQDTPALNRLIRKEESDDELLVFAIEMTMSDWNSTNPLVGQVCTLAQYPSLYLLMHGAAIQIMKTQGILQARNQLNYSAGGSNFMRSDKSGIYMQWLTTFVNDYETKKRNIKIHINITRGWGGMHSEYDRIGYAW
jgi:hypothetical protein